MKFLRLLLFMILSGIMLTSCDDELDEKTTLTFVGDSLVARWDLQSCFSSLNTVNSGLSGARIDYIRSFAGKLDGLNIVVLIGTNDWAEFSHDVETYAEIYLGAIVATGARKIYLYDVLPREFENDPDGINDFIRDFNASVAGKVGNYPHIVYMPVFDCFLDKEISIISEYYSDGLHLSPQGYEILSGKLFEQL